MVSYRTLSKIASAQYRAQSMQFEGTAARLDTLRRELERYKRLPEGRGEDRLFWAAAKLEDTKRALEHESDIAQRTGAMEEYEARRRAMGGMAKAAIFMGLVAAMAECSGAFLNSGAGTPRVVAAAIILAAAGQALFKIVDVIVFRGSFKENVDWIRCAIEECKCSVERKMDRDGASGN